MKFFQNKYCILVLAIIALATISAAGFGCAKYISSVNADSITINAVAYPWVDYRNSTGNFNVNVIEYANNKKIDYTSELQKGHDKVNIPIHRLEKGKWYVLTFSENIKEHGSGVFNPSTGIYGCSVRKEPDTRKEFKTMISLTAGNKYFVWTGMDGEHGSSANYTNVSNISIIFLAEDENMTWVWDLSKPLDGQTQTFYMENLQIRKLKLPTTGPRINFPETNLYNFYNKSNVGDEGDGENGGIGGDGIATFKTYADSTSLRMSLVGKNGYEKINIPINGLTAGNKYRIDYTASLTMMDKNKGMFIDHGFGYMIGDAENGSESSDLRKVPGFVNLTDAKEKVTNGYWNGSGNFTFNATQENHYWIWDASGLTDGKYFLKYMNFNNVSITHVIPVNLILTNMTVNRADDAEEGKDYSVILTPENGFNLPASVKVTIGGNAVTVYTNGTGNPEGYSFDASTKTLTISGELLTEEVSSFSIEAEGNKPLINLNKINIIKI